jgi:hypothetical protein
VRARLLASADWRDSYFGHLKGGLLNAKRALDGVRENILTTERTDKTTVEWSVTLNVVNGSVRVKIGGYQYDQGAPDNKSFKSDKVAWSRILRLKRTDLGADGTGLDSHFRITYVDDASSRLVTLQDATIEMPDKSPAFMPISSCAKRAAVRVAGMCEEMSVHEVVDYVAALGIDAKGF